MPWVRLDDRITEHPKIAEVGPLGLALFVAGLAYCNRNLTDGFIPWAEAEKLLSWKFLDTNGRDAERGAVVYTIGISSGMSGDDVTAEFVVTLLVTAGLWDKDDNGYRVHDFSDYQPSKKEVLAARRSSTDRQRKRRGINKLSNRPVTAMSQRDKPVSHGHVTPDPVPDPVPEKKEQPNNGWLAAFEEFWRFWPYRVARGQAETTFQKLYPSSLPEMSVLKAAVRVQQQEGGCLCAHTTQDGRDTRPHPSTWLNAKRWLDEVSGNDKPFVPTGPEFSKPRNFLLPVPKESQK
jgi:hypothetical protein